MEEKYSHAKLTFKEKLQNFWYYYKWHTLVIGVFLVFIIIASVQYFSAESFDAGIFYVDSYPISIKVTDDMKESMKKIITLDGNEDGKKSVDIKTVVLASNFDELLEENENADYQYEALKEYNNELLSGEFCIMLVDPYFYDQMQNDDVLQYISMLGGYGIPLNSLDIYKLPGFSELPDDTVLCFKKVGSESRSSEEDKNKIFESSYSVLQDMIVYEAK